MVDIASSYALMLFSWLTAGIRQRLRGQGADEAGVTTLELVIIALGLMAVAGLFAAALTTAVTRRTNQIH